MSNTTPFATVADIERLARPLTQAEQARANELLPVVSDELRQEAMNRGYNLDQMLNDGTLLRNAIIGVTVDITMRVLMTSTHDEPMTQFSQAAMGYSVSGSFLSPGGGLFIKDSELKRLGIKRQQLKTIEWYSV
jgi:hypothetical protein